MEPIPQLLVHNIFNIGRIINFETLLTQVFGNPFRERGDASVNTMKIWYAAA